MILDSSVLAAGGLVGLAGLLLAPEVRARRRASTLQAFRRAQSEGLADMLPYRCLVRSDVVKLAGGAYLAAWEFAGRDTATLDEAAIINVAYQASLAIGNLPVGTVVQLYSRRSPLVEYDRGIGEPHPMLETLDALRADFFTSRETVFGTQRFLALTWRSPELGAPVRRRASAALSIGVDGAARSEDALLAEFEGICAKIEAGCGSLNVRRLGEDGDGRSELLGFIRSCVSGEEGALVVPPPSQPLNAFLAREYRGGFYPRIGRSEVGCIELKTYASETWPGILDRLGALDVAHLLVVRFMPMPLVAAREQHRGTWAANEGQATFRGGLIDPHALKAADQAVEAYGAAADEHTRNGRTSVVLVLRAETRELVERGELAVRGALEEAGFVGEPRRLAALDTVLSTFPGDSVHGVRKHPLSALDVAHLMPLHETERGRRYADSESLPAQTPPVTYALGLGNTLSRLHLNGARDLGHAFVCGMPGVGKSVTLAAMAAMTYARLPNFGVTMLDKGRSAYRLAHMVDGTFYDLMEPGSRDGFALFSDVDDPEQAHEVLAILTEMLELWGVDVDAGQSDRLKEELRLIAGRPRSQRSLYSFVEQVQDPTGKLRPVLAQYHRLGQLGMALDCSSDSFESGRFNVVEIERVLALPLRFQIPMLRVLVWKLRSQVRRMRQTSPNLHWLYVIDELHAIAGTEIGEKFILDTLTMGRKENFFLWLASPAATDFTKMSNRNRLLMSCATRIYFGDPAATDDATKAHYADLQLPSSGIAQVPYLADREFLLHAPGRQTLQRLSLRLDRDVLAILTGVSLAQGDGLAERNARVDAFRERFPAERFGAQAWKIELLKAEGAHAAAALLEFILTKDARKEVSA